MTVNKHLAEVNCGFQFVAETVPWDSIYFGQFYDRISPLGFTERQERKGIQINFQGNLMDFSKPSIASSNVEDQVIFSNGEKGWAVMIGKNRISFHIVKNYGGWDTLTNGIMKPILKEYQGLGLGNGSRNCSVVYLNRFTKAVSEKLSDFFTIITSLEPKFGVETNTLVQRIISNEKNLLIAKLNAMVIQQTQNITFECGAICTNQECMTSTDLIFQANQTHGPIKNFFEAIITDKLRKEL